MVRSLGSAFVWASPFFVVALFHYGRYATLAPSTTDSRTTRARVVHAENFRQRMAQRAQALAEATASTVSKAASTAVEVAKSGFASAYSPLSLHFGVSFDGPRRPVVECRNLKPGNEFPQDFLIIWRRNYLTHKFCATAFEEDE